MGKRKVIIDCDTGVDDAIALFLALDFKDVDVIAITCVGGNCPLDNAVQNTLIVTKVAGKEVPVYRGCALPLCTVILEEGFHGSDGLNGASKEYPENAGRQKKHASQALVQMINNHPGEITLVALAALTNIAVAYRLDEHLSEKLQRLVVMGGNIEGKCNVKLCAEFNFAFDPEAAAIVVEETKCPLQIVAWEPSGINQQLSWEWYDAWVSKSTERCKFVKRIMDEFAAKIRAQSKSGFGICDTYAMFVALRPDLVKKSVHHRITVETGGTYSRGATVIDWIDFHFPRKTLPAELIQEICMEEYAKMMSAVTD